MYCATHFLVLELILKSEYLLFQNIRNFINYNDNNYDMKNVLLYEQKIETYENNDIKKDKLLNELGWRVIRFTASEINRNVDGCILILNKFIKNDIKYERIGIYHNKEHKSIEIVCENCKNISYKKTIKKNKSGNYFCSSSCSTIFGNKNTLKFKKKEICKKETFEQEINLTNKNFRKVERPSYDELIENITKLGYAGTGRKHNVSPTSVRKWLKMYEKYGENF